MLDATKSDEHRCLLEFELDAVGIRLNKTKPDVVFKRRTTGGVSFNYITPVQNAIDWLIYMPSE
jgi:ribosome-interacting GTPase 1